jgi:hypothetical protein
MRLCFHQTCLLVLYILLSASGQAQSKNKSIDSFIGVWKGTSLCQVKNSPCHDEIVVYRITKNAANDSCYISASKIVNDKEEDMGPLSCRFDPVNNTLESTAHNSKWSFKLENGKLKGTLIAQGNLYRIVELLKNQ